MLARAAEEQLGEQRELASAIGDIRNQLMRMSQELAEMRVRPPDETVDAQINHVTVEMREAVRFLSERLDGVTRMVAQRGEDLADIRTALTAIDTHVRSQAETIGVLSAGLQALPSYGERVSALQDNVQVLHQQLVGIEGSLAARPDGDDNYAERLESIESSIAPLAQRLDGGKRDRGRAVRLAVPAADLDVAAAAGGREPAGPDRPDRFGSHGDRRRYCWAGGRDRDRGGPRLANQRVGQCRRCGSPSSG